MITEFNILEDKKEGWTNHAIDIKTEKWITCKKFHYFINNESLCGKYRLPDDRDNILISGLFSDDCCKECLTIKRRR